MVNGQPGRQKKLGKNLEGFGQDFVKHMIFKNAWMDGWMDGFKKMANFRHFLGFPFDVMDKSHSFHRKR